MSWVWESSRSEGIDRLVLLAIADSANDDGGNAYPSVRTLSAKAKVGERTVQRAVSRLVEAGELTVKRNGGRAGANIYRIIMTPRHIDTPATLTPPVAPTPVTESPRPDDGVPERRDPPVTEASPPRPSDTRTVLEPSTNHPSPPTKLTRDTDPRFVEFWSVYPKRVAKADAMKALAKALAANVPIEDIVKAAARYRDDPRRDPDYTANPATWLNAGRWTDEARVAGPRAAERRPGDFSHYRASKDF